MINKFKNQAGFTLIEMLIVIVVLGILAMIIIPQITVSTTDAKVSTLQTNLSAIRSQIETYYVQHNSVYPGQKKHGDGTPAAVGDAPDAFLYQMILYSKANGETFHTKDTTDFKFGPYIKGKALPKNPFVGTSTLAADMSFNITDRSATFGTAWKIYPNTGVFIANDDAAHEDY